MSCNFLDNVGEVPAAWRVARGWLQAMLVEAESAIAEGNKIKLVPCGTGSTAFSALWSPCSVPLGALVISTCTIPTVHYWNGASWLGPFALNDVQNEIRVVPSGTPIVNFNAYFFGGVPPTTGAIVIENSAPVRNYYSWNGLSWERFAYPNVALGLVSAAGSVTTNTGPTTVASLSFGVNTSDLMTVGWNTIVTLVSGSPSYSVTVTIGTLGTFTYTGTPVGYITGMQSYVVPAGGTMNITVSTTITGAGWATIQERRLWANIVRNN